MFFKRTIITLIFAVLLLPAGAAAEDFGSLTIRITGPTPDSPYNEIYNARRLSNWTAIYVVMRQSYRADPKSNAWETYRLALNSGWLSEETRVEDFQTYQDLALLFMGIYNLKGGIMYSKYKNKRYAFKEMTYYGVFDNSVNPTDYVSGIYLFYYIQKMDDYFNNAVMYEWIK